MAETSSTAAENQIKGRGLGMALLLSYLVGFGLLILLIYYAEPWAIAGNTRVLDLLVRGGVVQLTDIHSKGLIQGVPEFKYYIWSQDPIQWTLVGMFVALYFVIYALRACQFHWIARYYGVQGTFGMHARAYLYGLGIGHILPFKQQYLSTAAALAAEGQSGARSYAASRVQETFIHFEVIFFALIGLCLTGWRAWVGQMFWPAIMLGAYYLFAKGAVLDSDLSSRIFRAKWRGLYAMLEEPPLVVKTALIGLFAFAISDIITYLVAQAFSTDNNVIMKAPFFALQAAVVGGYVASQIPISPVGIGQYEVAFAIVLLMSNVGLPEAVSITLIDSFARYGVALFLHFLVRLGYGIHTDIPTTLAIYSHAHGLTAWPEEKMTP